MAVDREICFKQEGVGLQDGDLVHLAIELQVGDSQQQINPSQGIRFKAETLIGGPHGPG